MRRRITFGLAAIFALTFLARLGTAAWASSRFAVYEARWKTEVAAERARTAALRQPVIVGTPLEENAASRLAKLTRRSELPDLEAAVRCTRCDWGEVSLLEPLPDLGGLEPLARRAVSDGKARAARGETRAAADRFFEAARLGVDLEASGLVGAATGARIEALALDALSKLEASPADGAWIASGLVRLRAARPRAAILVRQYRLGLHAIGAAAGEREKKGTQDERGGMLVVTPRATCELAAVELDELTLALEEAVAIDDPLERKKALALISERLHESWNPETKLWGAGLTGVRESWDRTDLAYAAAIAAASSR